MDSPNFRWLEPIRENLEDIDKDMAAFLNNPEGELKMLADSYDCIRETADKIDKWLYANRMELPRKFTDAQQCLSINLFANTAHSAIHLLVYLNTKIAECA